MTRLRLRHPRRQLRPLKAEVKAAKAAKEVKEIKEVRGDQEGKGAQKVAEVQVAAVVKQEAIVGRPGA